MRWERGMIVMKEKFWKRTWNGNQRLVGTWEEILQEKYFRFR